ncbi:MAG: HDOD domain-containing protein, partial [candidate division Zixibacteria bacterium]|nr:HDOD domain-containing protein [candidate division Zixibacteria bacterium]
MNRLQFEARLSSFRTLSTLPAVMAEVLRICDDPDSSLSELGEVIMRDVALMARVLKAANSPYYGTSQEISSIRQAVLTLGAARVKSLSLSLSLYELSSKIGGRINLKDFWRHSLNVACAAELIAKKVEPSLMEEAFICGCLHDIGVLVLDSIYAKDYAKVFQATAAGGDLVRVEQQLLEIDHAVAGEMVARIWNFPPRYCETIAHHHDVIGLETERKHDKLSLIINLANRLATFALEISQNTDRTLLSNREIVASNLGLSSADLKEIEYESLSKLLVTAQFLDMDVGTPVELLQRSTAQLYELYAQMEDMYKQLQETKDQLDEEKLNKVALESLQAIIATFSHYLNNAAATISGRTLLLDLAHKRGDLSDPTVILTKSLPVYGKAIDQILSVIDKL